MSPPSFARVVRLVGFIIRKTLGWCDEHGNPQTEQHLVSWSDFERAGISRQMIRGAIDEAINGHFIRCVREPRQQKAGQVAVTGLYELKWDERPDYIKSPQDFRGFFAGEGNRTYIPNQFFDHVVRHETLAVTKVVGSVIRFSIGFQNKFGHRRRTVSLSYQHIQNYSRIRDRKTLSAAVQCALESNYIERVEEGYFDPDAGRLSKAAVYAVKWRDLAAAGVNGRKSLPAKMGMETRSEKPIGNGQKLLPAKRSENPTDIEIKQRNKTYKQSADTAAALERLKAEGFDNRAAEAITRRYAAECIHRQIEWIDRRKVSANRLGMLRTAIDQDSAPPVTGRKLGRPNSARAPGARFVEAIEQSRRRLLDRPSSSTT